MIRRRKGDTRRGLAVVEVAVCLPVLTLLVFGAIEASSYIFLKQSLNVAAYEAVREAVRRDATNQTAVARAEVILNARGVRGFEVNLPTGALADARRGQLVRVEVTAPAADNSPLAGSFVPTRLLSSAVTMIKE